MKGAADKVAPLFLVEAPDAEAAFETAAKEFEVDTKQLMAVRRAAYPRASA
jgi:hypothetical protein